MQELFMKYPVDSMVNHNGSNYRVLGYEMYDEKRLLICGKGEDRIRIHVECLENAVSHAGFGKVKNWKSKELEKQKNWKSKKIGKAKN
ncbi:MAG: hypothetical protein HFI03_14660 [Lachnospiraceae bacterium]|jgi:hypothetical protein|nr:hypothetical protein [Lachnospiraceae bacterium]